MRTGYTYLLLFKPYGMLSQFTRESGWRSLADLGPLPPGVRPAGRLDVDSEGLLLLTDDPHVLHRLTTPRFRHPRTYLVQVEGEPTEEALTRLGRGIVLEGRPTLPADVRRLTYLPVLPERATPVRVRKLIPTAWIELTLREGRNRQVRKMTARVGHPTLRLVRIAIGPLRPGSLRPGEVRHLTVREREALLFDLGPRPTASPVRTRQRPPREGGRRRARRR